jgi:hypothetical protein
MRFNAFFLTRSFLYSDSFNPQHWTRISGLRRTGLRDCSIDRIFTFLRMNPQPECTQPTGKKFVSSNLLFDAGIRLLDRKKLSIGHSAATLF